MSKRRSSSFYVCGAVDHVSGAAPGGRAPTETTASVGQFSTAPCSVVEAGYYGRCCHVIMLLMYPLFMD